MYLSFLRILGRKLNNGMIINKNYYPCLWYEHENSYRLWYKSDWDNGYCKSTDLLDHDDKLLYLIDFFGNGVFKHWDIQDFIPVEILKRIKNKEIYLLLNCPGHGPHHLVEELYTDIIIKLQIDPSSIILSTESADIMRALDYVTSKWNRPSCQVQWVRDFEFNAKVEAYKGKQTTNYFKFERKKYTKKFLSFNGNIREHRTAYVWGLKALNILDKGLVSLNSKVPDSDINNTHWHIINTCKDKNLQTLLSDETLTQLNQLRIDDPTNKDIAGFSSEHSDYINQTYFSVITETNYELFRHHHENQNYELISDVGRIYSEKVFRSILFKHPFIVISNQYFLQGLKELGYKTFSSIIDESYDNEVNYSTRIYMILKETERLCNLTDIELNEFLAEAQNICDYNYNILLNQKNFKTILTV